jgi:hypothetical protein
MEQELTEENVRGIVRDEICKSIPPKYRNITSEQERKMDEMSGNALCLAYQRNQKMYEEQLSKWENLSFFKKFFTKKPKYH